VRIRAEDYQESVGSPALEPKGHSSRALQVNRGALLSARALPIVADESKLLLGHIKLTNENNLVQNKIEIQ
jgi:hypothetical protein